MAHFGGLDVARRMLLLGACWVTTILGCHCWAPLPGAIAGRHCRVPLPHCWVPWLGAILRGAIV